MDVSLVGPGRAGSALMLRLVESGHRVVEVLARDADRASLVAARLGGTPADWDTDLASVDLLVVAVRDDAITDVAARLSGRLGAVGGVVHLSGMAPASALEPAGEVPLGSFHPLQTLPTPEFGAARLEGAWVAITTDDDLFADRLYALAHSIGMHPFELTEQAKPLYHAAAAAAANHPLASLAMSQQLFEAAGVPFEAASPLVAAVVANAFEMGPVDALTGPVARGDAGTIRSQVAAVTAAAPELLDDFVAATRAVARVAGTSDIVDEVIE